MKPANLYCSEATIPGPCPGAARAGNGLSACTCGRKLKRKGRNLRNQRKLISEFLLINLNYTLCFILICIYFGVYMFYVLITVQYLNSFKCAKIKCLIKIACCFQHLCRENNGPLECRKLVKFSNVLRMTESSVKFASLITELLLWLRLH